MLSPLHDILPPLRRTVVSSCGFTHPALVLIESAAQPPVAALAVAEENSRYSW